MVAVIVGNLILLGFGYWWEANALKQFAAVVSGTMIAGWIVNECLNFNPIYNTIFWTAPAACGYFGVRAYWCLRECGGYPGGAPPDIGIDHCEMGGTCWIDFDQYSWNPSLPWYLSFFNGILDWVANLINFIPEMIMWINLVVGVAFFGLSLFYWRWGEVCTSLLTCCGICRGGSREEDDSSYDDEEVYAKAPGNNMPLLAVGAGAGANAGVGVAVTVQKIAREELGDDDQPHKRK